MTSPLSQLGGQQTSGLPLARRMRRRSSNRPRNLAQVEPSNAGLSPPAGPGKRAFPVEPTMPKRSAAVVPATPRTCRHLRRHSVSCSARLRSICTQTTRCRRSCVPGSCTCALERPSGRPSNAVHWLAGRHVRTASRHRAVGLILQSASRSRCSTLARPRSASARSSASTAFTSDSRKPRWRRAEKTLAWASMR